VAEGILGPVVEWFWAARTARGVKIRTNIVREFNIGEKNMETVTVIGR